MDSLHRIVTIDLDADLFQLLTSIQLKSIQEGKVPANFSEIINNLMLKLIKKHRTARNLNTPNRTTNMPLKYPGT